jgi:CBS domain-containing protein
MRRIAVGDIMTRKFISVRPGDSLHTCIKVIVREKVDSLLVVDGRRLVGILTARDILSAITKRFGVNLRKTKCISIAKKKLAVIKPSADISQALDKMKASNFRRLPVLSRNELIGVITLKDILAIAPELYSETKYLMDEIREAGRKHEQLEAPYPLEGLCENCGALSDLLKVEGQMLCPDCRDEMY